MSAAPLRTFYVSLTFDLAGAYLCFRAESERAVRTYLEREYIDARTGVWKLPWCRVYTEIPACDTGRALLIDAKCGSLHDGDF